MVLPGVYGDQEGRLVDENTSVAPTSKRGKLRVAAEKEWINQNFPLYIFRLPGIYGPGRGPLEKLRSATARRIKKEGHTFCRIHVDDICGAVYASMKQYTVAEPLKRLYPVIYNIVDDLPESASIVTLFGANLLCMKAPEEEDYETCTMTEMARSFYSESKKVSNAKMHEDLKYVLKYPTYKEGLVAQIEEEYGMTVKEFQKKERMKNLFIPLITAVSKVFSQIWVVLLFIFGSVSSMFVSSKVAKKTAVFLIDNGSVKAAATTNLRAIAAKLSKKLDITVEPVSVRWSDRIKASELGGISAEVLASAISKRASGGGVNHFLLLPLFFGPSESITTYIDKIKNDLKKDGLKVTIQVVSQFI
jgi:hypothetical protein